MTPEENKYLSDFYRQHHSKLFLRAYAMLKQRDLAEIAVQEAFLVPCKDISKLLTHENPIGWMKKIVENVSLHILRDQQQNRSLFVSLEGLISRKEPAVPNKSVFELKDFCLQVITQEDFDFFLRIVEDGYTYTEEAERLGISLNACYKRFERIRVRLQKALQNSAFEA